MPPSASHPSADKARDHLANERTFLAWVRTSIALLGFGVVIAKLRFLIGGATVGAAPAAGVGVGVGSGGRSLALGLAFCATGLATLLFAAYNYARSRRGIDRAEYAPPGAALAAFTLVVAALAVCSIWFLLRLGGPS